MFQFFPLQLVCWGWHILRKSSPREGLSIPDGGMYRLYWATSREEALAKHAADADNLIPELTHDHSAGVADHAATPSRPTLVH